MPLASRGVAGSQGRTPPSRNIPTTASLDIAPVEIAFTNWEAIQNIGRQDRPG